VLRFDDETGAFIDAFVPSGSGGLGNPDQLAFGPDGNLYVSDRFAAAIRRYNGTTGAFIDTPLSDGRLEGFVGFTFGADGKIYAGEYNGNHDVLRCDLATHVCSVFALGQSSLVSCSGITFGPDGKLYVAGLNSSNVVRFNGKTGAFIDVFVPAGRGGLGGADYLIFGPDGNLYVDSQRTQNTLRYNGIGAFIDDFAVVGGLGIPKGLAFFPSLAGSVVTLSRPRLSFLSRPVGTTSDPRIVVLTNTGKNAMRGYHIRVAFTAEFAQTNACPSVLQSMASCIIHVTFTPSTLGTRTGTLLVAGSNISGTKTVNLRGTGE
jgi:hypothetical protein